MLNTLYIIWLIYQTSSLGQSEAALTDIRHLNHVPPIIYNTLFIVCVKPNNVLKPAIFENLNIIQQLRCGVSISWSFFVFIAFI